MDAAGSSVADGAAAGSTEVDIGFELVEAENAVSAVEWRWRWLARRLRRLAFKRRQWSGLGSLLRQVKDRGRGA